MEDRFPVVFEGPQVAQVEEALGTALCHIGNKKLFTCSLETTNTGVCDHNNRPSVMNNNILKN